MDKLLLIDDETDVQYSFRRIFDQPDIELTTATSGEEGLKIIPRLKPDLVIMDVRMGGINGLETLRRLRQLDAKQMVIMMTAYGTTQTAIEAMKLGAYDYLLKPFDVPRLKQIVLNALKAARDMKQVVSYEPLLESEDYDVGIIGRSEAMQDVFKVIGQLASSDATALITGESGTGKELVARAIYQHGKRNGRPFLAINCAAIPENLLESELFGHERGAFTGATAQRIGKFEQCDGGTIFLDEIGDMTLSTQAKILRVLQSGSFERVGGNQPIQVDVRVIAATHKPLEEAVAAREFREDLFYRLNVLPIELKSFNELSDKERKEAILNKLRHIIYEKSKQPGDYTILDHLSGEGPESQIEFDREGDYVGEVTPDNEFISDEALQYLLNYSFPGNYRELDNIIRRAYVLSERGRIEASVLPDEVRNPDKSASPQEEIKTSDVDKVLAKDILDYAQDIKTDIVRRKIKSIYSKGQDLKSALRNEGIDKESDYQNINKKIVKIIGKEEMTRIRRGK